MTMVELELQTPNGLHDAYLMGLAVDFGKKVLMLELQWFVGVPDAATEDEREEYRAGTLQIEELFYCVSEAPMVASGYAGYPGGPSHIDGFETREVDIARCNLPAVPGDVFRHSIFVGTWNSFIHFAGTSATADFGLKVAPDSIGVALAR